MFWLNSPSTVSPRNANNLARSEMFLTATAGANGDFNVTIPNGANVATNDIVQISFPAATNGASVARLSINNGTTYKNIAVKTNLLANMVENKKIRFVYNGTLWVPLDPIRVSITGGYYVLHPDGKAEVFVETNVSMAASTAFGALYRYNSSAAGGVGFTLPDVFIASPRVFAILISSSTTKAGPHGYPTGAGPFVANLQFICTASAAGVTTQDVDFYVVGTWK